MELAHQALQWAAPEDHYVKGLAYAALGGGYRLTGNYPGSVDSYQVAIHHCRAGGHLAPEMLAVSWLTLMAIQYGNLHFAYETGSQAIERLEGEGVVHSPMVGAVYGCLGYACYEWNQLEKACSYLQQAIQLSSLSGHNAGVVYSKVILARVYHAQGDFQAATRTSQEAANLLPLGVPAWLKPEVVAHLVRIYLDQGHFAAVEVVLKQLEMFTTQEPVLLNQRDLSDPLTYQDGLKTLLSLRLSLHQVRARQDIDKIRQAVGLASLLIVRALSVEHIEIALQALLLRAQMYALQGSVESGLEDLCQAVELAEPEGYIRAFLDEGSPIAELLKLSLNPPGKPGLRQSGFIRQLLDSSNASATVSGPGESPVKLAALGPEEKLIEPLTGREMDVLRLMAEGLKYQEIAGRLFITLNTVRFYVKEIYSKLNVNNRTQAIEAAHKHHLL